MPQKIGVNEKCPCGSNLKYKKCCLKKDQESSKLPRIEGVLYGPLKAGIEDDFYNRFLFQNSNLRSFVVPTNKRLAFDKDYSSFEQNLLEAKLAKEFCLDYMSLHQQQIDEGKDGIVSGHQLNVNNPIDNELNIFFKDFFIRGTMAIEGLRRLLDTWFGYNITFLFTDDEKKFRKGANSFKLNKEDDRFQTLVEFVKSHRDGWYRNFKDVRDNIEHQGYKLPQIKHILDNNKVKIIFPKLGSQTIEEVLYIGWGNLSNLCEEIFVFVVSLELKDPYVIWKIPEEKRSNFNWARYKVAIPEYPEAQVSCS